MNAKNIFIEKAKKVHGDKYDYSQVVFISASQKIDIVNPKHEVILQTPKDYIRGKWF
jgi:hypothetical protein